ncbi:MULTISPECIES: DUF7144 family membrane protein [Protofrankia]|uniref:DoxX family protein n=1 Tax=Candidatus Protofrankia datiscae TaxID=2716812 RepID=F8AVF4_9ACTN|nr:MULTISPECIES: DoxX family protein [Protofrankia]AEH11258.1 DoxX family protein [Candidatus Protofrankia datiscae]
MQPARSAVRTTGWLAFAAVIIFIAGFHNIIYGVAALDRYTYLVSGSGMIIYQDLNFWGWLLIAMGIVEVVVAVGLLTGQRWARWAAIAICTVNVIAHLAFLAVFPVWAVVLIALDVLVIYAVTRPDTQPRGSYEPYPEADRVEARTGRGEYGAGRREYTEPSRSTTRGSRSGPDTPTH